MAAVTLTNQTANFDETPVLGLLNGETITLNNSTLNIDADVRWGQNAAVLGALTISSTLGGKINIDGTKTWWIPYDAPSGNVPALGTWSVQNCTGGTSGATGEFLGIFTALGVAPSTAGGALPATGFIKFRSKVGNFVDNEVITLPGGATITVNSATGGQRGWIHVVGLEATTITVPRLGKFTSLGDWFQIGVTNGADDQTFQYPVADNCPAIQVETAVGSGIYEWWLCGGARWGTATAFISQDARGKYFGCDNATGLLTIARRASNACGFKPASGLRVRIPNILVSGSTAANYALNTINTTLATRYDFTTTSAGDIDIQHICGSWFLSFASAFKVEVANCALLESITVSNTASTTNFTNVGIGINTVAAFNPITLANLFSGGAFTDVRVARALSTATNQFVASITDTVGVDFIRCMSEMFGNTTVTTRGSANVWCFLFTRANDFVMTDCTHIGAKLGLAQCVNVEVSGQQYADILIGTTTATNPISAIELSAASGNIIITGFSLFQGIANVHQVTSIVSILNCFDILVRNIGSVAAPYNMGTVNPGANIAGVNITNRVTFRRIYVINTLGATTNINLQNTVQNVLIENVWCDPGDAQALQGVAALARGVRWTPSATAQTAVYGTHFIEGFTSATAGFVSFVCNEPLPSTAAQVQVTAGTPKFTSTGLIAMPTLGDQVTWEMPYFILGHTALANVAPTITTSSAGNFLYEYQIDTGSGYSAWKTLNATNLSGETISPTLGFRMKFRITTTTAASTNTNTRVLITTVTNSTDQQIQYPLPKLQLASISGIVAGSRLRVYNVTTSTEIANLTVAGTTWSLDYTNGDEFDIGDVITVQLMQASGVVGYLPFSTTVIAGATGWSALANQVVDPFYLGDGSLVTIWTPNVSLLRFGLNSITNWLGQDFYNYVQFYQTTEDGIRRFFNCLTNIDGANIRINDSIVDMLIDNLTTDNVYQSDNIRIFRDDSAYPIANPTTGDGGIDINWRNVVYLAEVGTSGLTPTEAATLAKLDTLTEDVSGLRFTAKALEEAPAGGGGGSSDWTNTEKEQIRNRLGIDGTASAPSATPTLATPASVRTNLATELARIDVAISTRNSVVPTNLSAAQVRTELATELARIDQPISSRLASGSYVTPPTVVQIRTEMDTNSSKLDVAVGTRLAAAGYTAPANSDIASIKAKTDNLPADPASNTQVNTRESEADAATRQTALLTAIGSGGVTAAQIYDYFAFGTRPDIFKADLTNVLTQIATRASSAELTNQTTTLLTAIGTGGVTPAQIYDYFTALTRADAFKADLTAVLTAIGLTSTSAELTAQTTTLLTAIGSGGVTAAQIYDYFVDLNREDAFKADISDLPTKADLTDSETNILTAINDLEFGDVIRNELITATIGESLNLVATIDSQVTLTATIQE